MHLPNPQSDATAAANRRAAGRLSPYWLMCDLGTILDLSQTGMRIVSRKKLKSPVAVRIWDDRSGIQLMAEVCWSRKTGFRQHEAGLRFLNPDTETIRKLSVLASHARHV